MGASPTSDGRERTADLVAVALLILGIAFAFRDVLGPERGLAFRDHYLVFKPRWWFVVQALTEGRLPVLTEASPAGVPLEAMLNATYTPTTLLLLLGPFDVMYDVFVAAHGVLIATGTYVLARSLGCNALGATAAAIAASLTGPILSQESLLIGYQGLAYAPWAYWGLLRFLRAPNLKNVAIWALFSGFHVQGILPESMLTTVVVGLWLFWHIKPKVDLRFVALAVTAVVLGLCVAAIELMPVMDLIRESRRWKGFAYAEGSKWSMLPSQVVELFAPLFWSRPEAPFIMWPTRTGDNRGALYITLYLGTVLPLAMSALVHPETRKKALPFAVAGLIAFLAALGPLTPVHRLFSSFPILKSARYPVKYFALTVPALAAMVPLGLMALRKSPHIGAAIAGVQALGLLITYQIVGSEEFLNHISSEFVTTWVQLPVIGLPMADYPKIAQAGAVSAAIHGLIFASVLAAVCGLMARVDEAERRPWLIALVAVCMIDLGFAAKRNILGAPVEPSGPPPHVLQKLEEGRKRIYPISPDNKFAPIPHQQGRTYFEERAVSDQIRAQRLYRGVRRFEDNDADAQSHPASTRAFRLIQHMSGRRAQRVLARAGVGWVISRLADKVPGVVEFEVENEAPHTIFPIPDAADYIEVRDRWSPLDMKTASDLEFAKRITDDEHWGSALILEGDTTTSTVSCPERPTWSLSKESFNGYVDLTVKTGCEAIVVAQEVVFPRWVVEVDGRPAELLTIDFGVLGVKVPPGEHHVRFVYRSVTAGWAPVSVVAWLLCLLLIAFGERRSAG